jgi:hypothetical protein
VTKRDRPWTRKEQDALRALLAAGVRYRAAGVVLGRPTGAVSACASRLGLTTARAKHRHDETVRRLNRRGYCDWEVAIHLDVDRSLVQRIRARLGLPAADRHQSGIAAEREANKRRTA